MAVSVRLARPGDLAALDALFARSYARQLAADYPPSVLVTALPVLARAQPRLLASGSYFVAEEEGRVLGAGGWTPGAPGSGRKGPAVGHVRHVVTDDRAVRRGIGRAVLDAAMTQARTAGVRRLDCLSTRTAVPFYRALGFVSGAEVIITLAPGITFPAVGMSCDLQGPGSR